jgi:transposase
MPKQRLTVTKASPEEIETLLRKDEKYMIGVKLYTIYQVSKGASSRELEDVFKVSFKSICNWVNEFNEKGLEGLANKLKPGRKPRLSQEQKEEIRQTVIATSPENFDYNTNIWTGAILIDYIKKRYGVEYKRAQIYNILKGLGISYQKSKGKYPEANEEARQEYQDTLKKTSNRIARNSISI